MAHIVFKDKESAPSQRVELRAGSNRLGRGRDNEIMVPHGRLSRAHARLEFEDGRVTLHDLGSSNGTEFKGQRITTARLRNGDTFRCGDIEFTLGIEATDSIGPTLNVRRESNDLNRSLDELLGQEDQGSAIRVRGGSDRSVIKLRVLLEVGHTLSSPGTLDELLRLVLDLLFRVFDVDRAALVLVDESTGELGETTASARAGSLGSEAIYSRNIAEQVRSSGVGVVVADALSDPRFAHAPSVQTTSIRASMCAPLLARGKVLGVVYVDHLRVPSRYGAEDLEFLTSFGVQAATAVENARLYLKLEDEAIQRSRLLRFFPPAVLKSLQETKGFGDPRDHEVTVLFSDISGFTSMSSTMKSSDVVGLLNRYFPPMAEIVFRHEGTLEKYIGDALMAIWGAPMGHDDDADRALMAAVEMTEALERMNAEGARHGSPPLAVHIGLNSGPVTFGNIGSAEYVQFAAIGDTTNVASRVCSVAQSGEVVISAATLSRLRHRGDWTLDSLPPATVKGKDQALELYRVSRAPGR